MNDEWSIASMTDDQINSPLIIHRFSNISWYPCPSLLPLDLSQVLIAFTVLVFSLTVHEASHAWSADLLGDPTASARGRVSLRPSVHIDPIGTLAFPLVSIVSGFPPIGWGRPVPVSPGELGAAWRRKYVIIAAAGPASNLALAALAAVLIRLGLAATGFGVDQVIGRLLFTAINLNLLLVVFNLLPVPPLDGGQVIAGLLRGSDAAMFARLRPYGVVVLFALMLTGRLWTVLDPIRGALQSVLL
jgi:Zn-dependent protease